MEGPLPPSDAERELNDLRARAYGPDHDIETDPAALRRLVELESARVAGTAARSGIGVPAAQRAVGGGAAPASRRAESASIEGATAPVPTVSEAAEAAPAGAGMEGELASGTPGRFWRSLWRRGTATWPRRISFLSAAGVVLILVVYALTWLL